MPAGKDRLYVALYARGGQAKMPGLEDTYHWALIIGPKDETSEGRGTRLYAKERLKEDGTIGWQFEERETPLIATQMILVRICVGKIEKRNKVKDILRNVPVRGTVPGWNCVYWVSEALKLLHDEGKAMGTSELDWTYVRNSAMAYIERKKNEHRFDGRGRFDTTKPATYDLLEGVEIIP